MLLMTSPHVIAPTGVPNPSVVQALIDIRASGTPVGVVSNGEEPAWFSASFKGSSVVYLEEMGRQTGQIVKFNAQRFKLEPYDTLVLAGKPEDVQMGKNGGAVLIAAGWIAAPYINSLGIQAAATADLKEIVELSAQWSGQWWYEGRETHYSVLALSDLSGLHQTNSQRLFAQSVTALVKNGGSRLMALLAIASRSLLKTGYRAIDDLMWGVYPSSSSTNQDDEVLSDFTHRLRTTVSSVRLAKRGEPLFIRHAASLKRSRGNIGADVRTDPSGQVETLHLNPAYRKNIRGRNVVVIDDCTTYGVSFGVAAAFLRKAGAASVCGVALGKFGKQLHYYEIDIKTDPFAPVSSGNYSLAIARKFSGKDNPVAQNNLRILFK